MLHYWLLFALSWFGFVSPQYINSEGPGDEAVLEPLEATLRNSLQHIQFYNLPETQYDDSSFYPRQYGEQDFHRIRRTVLAADQERDTKLNDETAEPLWLPNLVDTDQTNYLHSDIKNPIVLQEFTGTIETNSSDSMIPNMLTAMEKKSFSPWGGKRDGKPAFEHMWTWRRPNSLKEPSMPKSAKRVRFSPWGGKRSSPLIYNQSAKNSKIILSNTPELTRFLSNYLPNGNRFSLTGFEMLKSLDKRHPIRVLALSTRPDDKGKREALPFHTFFETLPKLFKPGHPYADVNLKKDGKRKVKFSAWGGKRAPPIIGPIWTPTSQLDKDSTLDALLLVRDRKKILAAKAL